MRVLTRTLTGAAATGAAVVAALGLAAGPASAAVTSATVTGGGSFSAASGAVVFKDATTGFSVTCASDTVAGVAPNGTYTTGAPTAIRVGSLSSGTFTSCAYALGPLSFAAQSVPWPVDVTGPTSAGVTAISMPGAVLHMTGACAATLTGTVSGTYSDSGHSLSLNGGSLTASAVSGTCVGLSNGDTFTLTGALIFSPATLVIQAV
ncbi:hypothetical protein [Actinacidiphila yeochonensis]|uniref:hypothetical protein n=1 Tax=Actinacidiphila yeochonensis TaxID=89050 RepID=UPI00056C613D|nr:hypothetical protein [Actinacidiphila yeochonensis]